MNGGDYYMRRTGSVKAAINLFREKFLDGNPPMKTPFIDYASSSSDLHFAKRDMSKYKESMGAAESEKARVESELLNSSKFATELSLMIEKSNSNAHAQTRDIEMPNKLEMSNKEGYRYAEVMRELEFVKQELSKLKLDMAAVLEVKLQAENEADASNSKLLAVSNSVEDLKAEIEATNEEHVLVELARIEALKECREIEAEREKESSEFSFKLEKTKKKTKDMVDEIDQSKELKNKLAVTLTDINVLQNELQLVKKVDHIFRKTEESQDSPLLQSITDELEAAKKELASIREESFQFMTSMDIVRNELKHVTEETARLNKTEEKDESKVQKLKSKLVKAKSKLEASTAAEQKSTTTLASLTHTLDQLKAEAESAKQEKTLIINETATIKEEIQKTETNIDTTEEKLQAAMQELETIKSTETSALAYLKYTMENTMRARAAASQHGSSIVLSKFEYDYLTSRANLAEKVADKKVAAAQAWIEALKESEKEILMKCELAHQDIRQMREDDEKEVRRSESSRMLEGQMRNLDKLWEKNAAPEDNSKKLSRKSMKMTPWSRVKMRTSSSPAYRTARTGSFRVKKKEGLPNLSRIFNGKRTEECV